MIYPAQLYVFGGGMSPQISYKYDRASSSWKKHFNIYDHLGTLAQTYKKVGIFGITPTSMQTHNPFGSERWTNSNLAETESTLLNWIGKEKDYESKLGDHGVRKYEYETGRFISIDPLWGKYYGWTPYQYSMNSPVMLVDIDGKVVRDEDGKIKLDAIEERVESHPGDMFKVNVSLIFGYIYADDGRRIEAFKNNSSDERFTTNCHGCTFADGEYWINDDQVNNLLEGDGYQMRLFSDISPSDIVVFVGWNEEMGIHVVHSETVSKVSGKDIWVRGLGGLQTEQTEKSMDIITPGGYGGGVPYILNTFYYKPE